MRTRIYEDNGGHIFAIVMDDGDVAKVVDGIETVQDYDMKSLIADAIDGFADWESACEESSMEDLASDIRHCSNCVADIESGGDDDYMFLRNASFYWDEMGVAAKAIFGKLKGDFTMTNADRIRSMTNDELFKFIDKVLIGDLDFSCTFCDVCESSGGNGLGLDCDGCLKWWLTLDAKKHPQGLDFFS